MLDVDSPKALSNPIFSTVDTDLKKVEAELWWPRFVILPKKTKDVNIRNVVTGQATLWDDEREKMKGFLIFKVGQKVSQATERQLLNKTSEDLVEITELVIQLKERL